MIPSSMTNLVIMMFVYLSGVPRLPAAAEPIFNRSDAIWPFEILHIYLKPVLTTSMLCIKTLAQLRRAFRAWSRRATTPTLLEKNYFAHRGGIIRKVTCMWVPLACFIMTSWWWREPPHLSHLAGRVASVPWVSPHASTVASSSVTTPLVWLGGVECVAPDGV